MIRYQLCPCTIETGNIPCTPHSTRQGDATWVALRAAPLCPSRSRYLRARFHKPLFRQTEEQRTFVGDRGAGHIDELHHRLLVRDFPTRFLRIIVDGNDSVEL